MEEQILGYISELFTSFGYWFIALVFANFLIMLPIAWGLSKAFAKSKSDVANRLRKLLTSLSVFVVAGGCITALCAILHKPLDFHFILVNVIPCGGCAMLIWSVVKIIRDFGFKALLELIANSNTVKKLLKQIPVDKDIKNAVYTQLCDLVKNSDGENAKLVVEKSLELTTRAEQMLQGFVENPKEVAKKFVEVLQLKFKQK